MWMEGSTRGDRWHHLASIWLVLSSLWCHSGAIAASSTGESTMEKQGPAIRVSGLRKSYKKLEVLKGVDFEVARGSIYALLGSNGAGKTTIVRILSTLLQADDGDASVNGFD